MKTVIAAWVLAGSLMLPIAAWSEEADSSLEAQNRALKKELKAIKHMHEAALKTAHTRGRALASLDSYYSAAKKKIGEREEQINALEKRNQSLLDEMDRIRRGKKPEESRIAKLQSRVDELEKEGKRQQAEKDALEKDLEEESAVRKKVQKELAKSGDQIRKELTDSREKASNARQSLAEAEKTAKEADEKIKALQKNVERVQEENEDLIRQQEKHDKALAKHNHQIEEQAAHIAAMETELETARDAADNSQPLARKREKQIQALSKDLPPASSQRNAGYWLAGAWSSCCLLRGRMAC